MADEFGAADASRQERQGALAAQGGGAWGGSFPAANFSGDDGGGGGGGGGGGVSSLTADFQRGMDFSGSGDAPTPSAADPIAYVGSGTGQPTTAAKPEPRHAGAAGGAAGRAVGSSTCSRRPPRARGTRRSCCDTSRTCRTVHQLLLYSRVPAGRYFWLC